MAQRKRTSPRRRAARVASTPCLAHGHGPSRIRQHIQSAAPTQHAGASMHLGRRMPTQPPQTSIYRKRGRRHGLAQLLGPNAVVPLPDILPPIAPKEGKLLVEEDGPVVHQPGHCEGVSRATNKNEGGGDRGAAEPSKGLACAAPARQQSSRRARRGLGRSRNGSGHARNAKTAGDARCCQYCH